MNTKQNEATQNLINAVIGLGATISEAMDNDSSFVPCGKPAAVVNKALELATTNTPDEALIQHTQAVNAFTQHVSEHRGVSAHNVQLTTFSEEQQKLFETTAKRALEVQKSEEHQPEIMAQIYRNLASLA